MSVLYEITHRTIYRYSEEVRFGEHRVLFRPRDSHDLRVLATDLRVSPTAAIRLIQDPHSNSVALVQPIQPASQLEIVCSFTMEHAHTNNLELPVSAAGWVPFDPTNNLLGGTQLIRVGVARHPAQAAPVAGSWFGKASSYLGMSVDVQVKRKGLPWRQAQPESGLQSSHPALAV